MAYVSYILINIKFSVVTVWHCCDIEIWSRSLKVVWTGKLQWVLTSCKIWHLSHLSFGVWQNCYLDFNISTLDRPEMCQLSPSYTHQSQSHTYHVVHDCFNVCRNHTKLKLQETSIPNMQFTIYISDTPVTLKQSQGQQT